MSNPSSKSAAETAMSQLSAAMDRNTQLVMEAPVVRSAITPAKPLSKSPTKTQARVSAIQSPIRTSGVRLTGSDYDHINRILQQALSLGERLPMIYAIRLALTAYDTRKLTKADIEAMKAADGRTRDRKRG